MSFWGELKRRNVFKVGAAYVIAAWLIVQVANTFFPLFHMPGWTVTLVASLLVLGLPITLIIAWAFELTPEGVKRSENVPLDESITHVTGRKLNYVLVGLIIVLVGYIVIDKVLIGRSPVETEVALPVAEQVATTPEVKEEPKTIAVLPFVNLSSDPEQEYFVDGLSEEILNSLAQISDLTVIARTSSFTFKGSDKKIQEIAQELGVAHILEGSVRKSGNALRITAQLIKGVDGSHLWSRTYDRELKDIFTVQENIAKAVANELKVTLGIEKSFNQLGSTDNEEAYELYLVAKGIHARTKSFEDTQRALALIEEAISLDPGFSLAWTQKAIMHLVIGMNAPEKNRVASEFDLALNATHRAIELEPNLAVAHALLGGPRWYIGEWIEAELAFRKAFEMTKEPFSLWDRVPQYYASVGNFKRAYELSEAARTSDPFNISTRNQLIFDLGLLGDIQGAEDENDRCIAAFGDTWKTYSWAITYLRLGTGNPVYRDQIRSPHDIDDIGKKYLDSPKEGLAALRRIVNDEDYKNDPTNSANATLASISLWAAYFGDPEFAMDVTEKAFGFNAGRTYNIWFPVMHEVRQLPRFNEFVRGIGLVDYWEQFGWPDLCHPTDNGDFECD